MDRISAAGYVLDPSGNRIFSDGNPFSTPSTNGTIVDAKWLTGVQEMLLAVVQATGRVPSDLDQTQLLAAIQDLIAGSVQRKRAFYWGCKTGLATLDVLGMSAPTIVGTASYLSTSRGPYLSIVTIDSATDRDAGVLGPYDAMERRWKPDVTFKIDTNTLTDSRMWVGLFSASPMALTTPTAISSLGFRYENGVDTGATWRTVSSDGAGTPSVKDTLVPIVINTSYELRIRNPSGGKFEFMINGVVVTTHDSALGDIVPAAATTLGPVAALRHSIPSGATKTIRVGYVNGVSL